MQHKRCFQCKKKTLMLNECKCKNNYCLNCSPFFNHNCIFNYKEEKQTQLCKDNVKIIAKKVDEI